MSTNSITPIKNLRVTGFEPAKYEVKVHFLNHLDTLFILNKTKEKGIEPLPLVLKTNILPLNYSLELTVTGFEPVLMP